MKDCFLDDFEMKKKAQLPVGIKPSSSKSRGKHSNATVLQPLAFSPQNDLLG